jgi:peptide/nickel transport system ATP-binding protein
MTAVLEAHSLRKSFPVSRDLLGRVKGWTHAVTDVSVSVACGETLGLLGESGAGKSTVGRMLLRLIEPDEGTITFKGADVRALGRKELRAWRSRARMVFQDPFLSLDPSMPVGNSVAEALKVHEGLKGADLRGRVVDLFERVGLGAEHLDRYPSEFSGGQLQRVAVARAVSTNPDAVICDEPVAALDMSIRAQVINLLRDLQEERGIALVFISHDLSLVRMIADRVAVMYRGRVVEAGDAQEVFADPGHPYTQTLLAGIPVPDPDRRHLLAAPVARGRDADDQLADPA